MDTLKLIKENILTTLKEEKIGVVEIFLFGSRARKRHTELSDYDLLIIVRNKLDGHTKRELRKKIFNKLHLTFPVVSFDIIVKPKDEFEAEKQVVNTLSNEVLLEGIKI